MAAGAAVGRVRAVGWAAAVQAMAAAEGFLVEGVRAGVAEGWGWVEAKQAQVGAGWG